MGVAGKSEFCKVDEQTGDPGKGRAKVVIRVWMQSRDRICSSLESSFFSLSLS